MILSGIAIDPAHTKYAEDGFRITKLGNYYLLDIAVVDVGSRVKDYDNYLTGHNRDYLFPINNIKKSELSFCELPRNCFAFQLKISPEGLVEHFVPSKCLFEIEKKFDSEGELDDEDLKLAKQCLDLVARSGVYPLVSVSNKRSQLVQNITALLSLTLFDFMTNKVGVSVFFNGVQASGPVFDDSASYKGDSGRLVMLDGPVGLYIESGEGFLVNTERTRGCVYGNSDIGKAGNYLMPISSPFRDDDALLNQIILSEFIDINGSPNVKPDYLVYGPCKEIRQRYLMLTERAIKLSKNHDPANKIAGKTLRNYISFLIEYELESRQIVKLAALPPASASESCLIATYFLAKNLPLPEKLYQWMKSLCVDGNNGAGMFFHYFFTMPFVSTSNSGGVHSITVCDRVFEVDDCNGYRVRLLRKIIEGQDRGVRSVPPTLKGKLALLEALLLDPLVVEHITSHKLFIDLPRETQ